MHTQVLRTLERIWHQNISVDFEEGVILTERDLQCCLYFHLRTELADSGAHLFVEPSLCGQERRIPDMVIAVPQATDPDTYLILLFLELKLDAYIQFAGELTRIEERGSCQVFASTRRRLDGKKKPTFISDDRTRFALGFVGAADAKAVYLNDILAHAGGRRFLGEHSQVAARTTLLFGRIHSDGTRHFASEPFPAQELVR